VTAITALGTIPTPTSALELWYGIAGPISARSPRDVGYISAISRAVLSLSLFTTVYMIGTIGMLIGNLNATAVTFRKKLEALDVFIVKKGAEIAPRSRRDRISAESRRDLAGLSAELGARLHRYHLCAWSRGVGHYLGEVRPVSSYVEVLYRERLL